MLLKKKYAFLFFISVFLIIFLALSKAQTSTACSSSDIKESLRKALFEYFYYPNEAKLSVNEIKDFIHFYITSNTSQVTLDCSGMGPFSGKPYYLMLGTARKIGKEIPKCADGAQYGKCSSNMPYFCYGGKLVERCSFCGCGANARCDTSTNKCIKNVLNITCNINAECGTDGYTGLYICFNGSVYRNYTINTCYEPTTIYSSCSRTTSSELVDKCGLGTICINGQSACQNTVADLAPTAAISIAPKTVAVGQQFNITVIGTDDVGLNMIWWFGINSSDAELSKAHIYACSNSTFCKNTWTASTNFAGTFNIGANSRDTSYPVAGEPHQASEGDGIAYDTVTVTSAPIPSLDTVTVKGRLVDYFSQAPIAGALIYTWDNQTRRDVYSNANGDFSTYADTRTITQTSPKGYGIIPNCYMGMGFAMFRKTDSSLYVNFQINSLIGPAKAFTVANPEVNAGDVPMWPAVDVAVNTDIPVQFFIEYSTQQGSGNVFYKTSHYLSNAFPLNADTRIKLIDSLGKVYYSPYINLPLSHGCAPVKLSFFNNQFSWNGTPTNQTPINQTPTNQSNQTNITSLQAFWASGGNGWPPLWIYSQQIKFSYPTASISSVQAFKLYEKKPTDANFNLVATFANPASIGTACSGSIRSVPWTLRYYCPPVANPAYWIAEIDTNPSSYYPIGQYDFYMTVVDLSGAESSPSSIATQYALERTTILSPIGLQQSQNPALRWTVASTWPLFPAPYKIKVANNNVIGSFVYDPAVVYSNSPEGSDTYAGAALNPSYTYTAYVDGSNVINGKYYISMMANSTVFWVANRTNNTCIGVDRLIDFEDPPHLSFHLTWNPDLGTQDSYNYNLDETARNWLRAKGIEINATPNSIVWGTKISGPVGITGVIVGDASPNFLESDQGISDNELLTVRFTSTLAKSFTAGLTSTPSDVSSINNIPTTVTMDAFDRAGNLVGSATMTFTGVTNSVYTPTTLDVSSSNFDIAKVTFRATQYPAGGLWLENISFKGCN